jgi:hypothetical protein
MEQASASNALETPLPDKAKAGKSMPSVVKNRGGGVVIERPGSELGVWERWYIREAGNAELLETGDPLPQKTSRIVVLPSAFLFSWPLWIAQEGDSRELVKMELAGRHLLKRGMEEGLITLPIAQLGERRLVLAMTTDEPFPEDAMPDGWKSASHFEIPARLRSLQGNPDLLLWQEQGVIHAAFYREGQIVWFCPVRLGLTGTTLHRTALRLLSEGILGHIPSRILLEGITAKESDALASELSPNFPGASISSLSKVPPPSVPATLIDLPPAAARQARIRKQRADRFLSIGSVAAILYLLLLAWGSGDLLIRQNALKKIRGETARLEAPARQARAASERWTALRPAIDPSTYPLDLLAAVAAPTEGGKVRLINFNLELGHLQISGEATDVTQAYAFIEQLKKNPLLQEYDWTSGQPQLAGKNSVKFEMDGTRAGASQTTP